MNQQAEPETTPENTSKTPDFSGNRKENTVILIDGNALMHRSYHGMQKGFMPTHEGMPIGMVYGFANTIVRILQDGMPDYFIVTFDTKEKTFRHDIDPEYKAQRSKAPDDFYPQIPLLKKFVGSGDFIMYEKPGYESDDLIGTLAIEARKKDYNVEIYSGDLDFLQLVGDPGITMMKYSSFGNAITPYNAPETIARFGVKPEQIIDYKAVTGDSSDNYKGIPGVGPKTAKALFDAYHTLDGIYANLDTMKPKMKEKFEVNKEYAYHCQHLATIHTSVEIDLPFEEQWTINVPKLEEFLDLMKFQAIRGRLEKLIYKSTQEKTKKKGPSEQENESQMSLF